MSACLIFWDVSVTQTDQPNFRPDNIHFTPPGQINPTCGNLWLRLKPNTWTLSDMSLLAAGNDLRRAKGATATIVGAHKLVHYTV